MEVLLFTDGAARSNPNGAGAAGYLIILPGGTRVGPKSKSLGVSSNFEAEYRAMILGLEACRTLGATRVHATSDSLTMVRQLNGENRLKAANLIPLYTRIRRLEGEIGPVDYQHTLRGHPEIVAVDRANNALLNGLDDRPG